MNRTTDQLGRGPRKSLAFSLGLMFTLSLWTLTSCATATQQRDSLEDLQRSITAYNHAFRWKTYARAAQFLPVDLREPFVSAYEDGASSLQVEECKLSRLDMEAKDRAKVTVRVRYLMLPSVVVQKRKLIQYWQKISGHWILETEENSIRKIEPVDSVTTEPKEVVAPPSAAEN